MWTTTEDMAINKNEWGEIDGKIQAAVHPSGLKKALSIAKEYGSVGTYVAIVLALLTLAGTQYNLANHRMADQARFEERTDRRLTAIEVGLRLMRVSQQPKQVLQEVAGLTGKEFSSNFPVLQKIADEPPGRVGANLATLQQVAHNLRDAEQNAPDYWATVLQFIRFASAGISPNVPPPGLPQVIISNNEGLSLKGNFSDRIVLLDGGDLAGDISFTRCRIILSGNPIKMKGVRFTDCVFEMPVTDSPSPLVARVATQLLASSLQSVVLQTP